MPPTALPSPAAPRDAACDAARDAVAFPCRRSLRRGRRPRSRPRRPYAGRAARALAVTRTFLAVLAAAVPRRAALAASLAAPRVCVRLVIV
jgi:hypothetical protein